MDESQDIPEPLNPADDPNRDITSLAINGAIHDLFREGKYDEAIRIGEDRVLDYSGTSHDSSDLRNAIASCYRAKAISMNGTGDKIIKQGLYKKAIKHLRAGINAEPDKFRSWQTLGEIHTELGQHDLAIEVFQALMHTDSSQAGFAMSWVVRNQRLQKDWPAMEETARQMLLRAEYLKDDTEECIARTYIVQALLGYQHPVKNKEAQIEAQALIDCAERCGNNKARISGHQMLMKAMSWEEGLDTWQEIERQSRERLNVARRMNNVDEEFMAGAALIQSLLKQGTPEKLGQAEQEARWQVNVAKRTHNPRDESAALSTLIHILTQHPSREKMDEVETLAREKVAILKSNGAKPRDEIIARCQLLNTLSRRHNRVKSHEAELEARDLITLTQSVNDALGEGVARMRLTQALLGQRIWHEAEAEARGFLTHAKLQNDEKGQIYAYTLLSQALNSQKQPDKLAEAEEHLGFLLKLAEKTDDSKTKTIALGLLANGLLAQHKIPEAREAIAKLENIGEETGYTLALTVRANFEDGKYDKALAGALRLNNEFPFSPLQMDLLRVTAHKLGRDNDYAAYVAAAKQRGDIAPNDTSFDPLEGSYGPDKEAELLREIDDKTVGKYTRSDIFNTPQYTKPINMDTVRVLGTDKWNR